MHQRRIRVRKWSSTAELVSLVKEDLTTLKLPAPKDKYIRRVDDCVHLACFDMNLCNEPLRREARADCTSLSSPGQAEHHLLKSDEQSPLIRDNSTSIPSPLYVAEPKGTFRDAELTPPTQYDETIDRLPHQFFGTQDEMRVPTKRSRHLPRELDLRGARGVILVGLKRKVDWEKTLSVMYDSIHVERRRCMRAEPVLADVFVMLALVYGAR